MLILLPPSEGKAPSPRGAALKLDALGFPGLHAVREAIIDSLVGLCRGSRPTARTVLGVTARLDDEIVRNTQLRTSPCAPAGEVYTGVLYDALDWSTLTAADRNRADKRVAIASALFGLLRPTDPIPAYRLSADTTLPGVGRLRSNWSKVLPHAIAEAAPRGVVWDLRSSAYVALGPVPQQLAERTVITRILQVTGSRRVVVSHHNKATKGRLTRTLLRGPAPKSVPDLADSLDAAGYRVELHTGRDESTPWTLDVIVEEV